MREEKIVVVSASALANDGGLLRGIKGSPFGSPDLRFFIVAVISFLLHLVAAHLLNSVKIPVSEAPSLEKIPERFARLIIEKPIPKTPPQQNKSASSDAGKSGATEAERVPASEKGGAASAPVSAAVAKKRVASNAQRVENKIRNVGALGILSGVGATAKGAKVVDVLGTTGRSTSRIQDFESILSKGDGLVRVKNVEVLDAKLVKSKDAGITRREEINDLISGIGMAQTGQLAKKGDLIIQRPESIEGAASQNAKRDNTAINSIVATYKIGIRMTYDKFLARNPALAGKITVRFTIAASGSITDVQILENTTGDTEFETEVVRKIRLWKFEPVDEGDATVTYPLVFMAS